MIWFSMIHTSPRILTPASARIIACLRNRVMQHRTDSACAHLGMEIRMVPPILCCIKSTRTCSPPVRQISRMASGPLQDLLQPAVGLRRKGLYFFWPGFLSTNQAPTSTTIAPTAAPRSCFQPKLALPPIPITSAASETASTITPRAINTRPIVFFDICASFWNGIRFFHSWWSLSRAPPFRHIPQISALGRNNTARITSLAGSVMRAVLSLVLPSGQVQLNLRSRINLNASGQVHGIYPQLRWKRPRQPNPCDFAGKA